MKYLIWILIALCGSLQSFAQMNSVTGTMQMDDPESASTFYRLRIPLYCVSLAPYNISVYDLAFGLDAKPISDLMINVDYRIGLGDMAFPENTLNRDSPSAFGGGGVIPQNKPLASRLIDVAAMYFISNKSVKKDLSFNLKRVANVDYVTYVPGTELRQIGIRAGFLAGSTWYGMNDMLVNYSSSLDFLNGSNELSQSTNLRYSQLRFGLAYMKTSNIWVDFDDIGMRGNVGSLMYYADILIGMRSQLDDVYHAVRGVEEDGNTFFVTRGSVDEENEKARIGFEIGMRQLPTNGMLAGYAALGRVNGIQGGTNGYFRLGVQLSLGTRSAQPEGAKRKQKSK